MDEKKKQAILYIISFILGYMIYRYVSLSMIYSLYNLDPVGKALVLYLIHVAVLLYIFKRIFHISVYRREKIFFLFLYLVLLFMVYFDRPEIFDRRIEWTLLNLSEESWMIYILNI